MAKDPRQKWSKKDWMIAHVYFLMNKCTPPGIAFLKFYQWCATHKPEPYARVSKTIREIVAYRGEQFTQQDKCVATKIVKLWKKLATEEV